MKKIFFNIYLLSLISITAFSQDRITEINNKLQVLAQTTAPGLNEEVEISVNDLVLQEFIRAIANVHSINVGIDTDLQETRIINNFAGEKVYNVLTYLCKEYDLTIEFIGNILHIKPFDRPKIIIDTVKGPDVQIADSLVSWDLKGDKLSDVMKISTQATGVNFIIARELRNQQLSSYVQNLPLNKALDNLAFENDLVIRPNEEGNAYYIEKIAVIAPSQNSRNSSSSKNKNAARPEINNELYYKIYEDPNAIKLIEVSAGSVSIDDMFRIIADDLDIDYFMYEPLQGEVTCDIKACTFDTFLELILNNSDYNFTKQENIYVLGKRLSEGFRETVIYKFKHRTFETILQQVPNYIQNANLKLNEFPDLNAIVISGAQKEIREAVRFLEAMDIKTPVIGLEVIQVDIRKGRTTSTGVEAGLSSDSITTGGRFLPGLDMTFSSGSVNDFLEMISSTMPINLGNVTPDFYVALRAIQELDNVKVHNTTKLSMINGHPGSILTGTTRYYVIEQSNLVGTQNPVINNTRQFNAVTANQTVNITPSLSENGLVTLKIEVQISDFLGNPPGNAPPPSSNRSLNSIISVNNGEMVVLGGIERVEDGESSTGLPILSRIPIIKWLFSSRTKTKNEVASTLFIKPVIISGY